MKLESSDLPALIKLLEAQRQTTNALYDLIVAINEREKEKEKTTKQIKLKAV